MTWIYPTGRAEDNSLKTKHTSTACFNIRAISGQLDERMDDLHFVDVLDVLNSKGKVCTPAIDVLGNIKLGESDLCPVCSNIFSRSEDIISDIVAFKCKKCYPLNTGLPVELRRLIGEV